MDNSMFKVTKDWIHKHKTKRGAWTKSQIEALGLAWPATHGWIRQMDGELITNEQARIFEEAKPSNSNLKRVGAMQKLKDENEALKLEVKRLNHLIAHSG